MRFPKKLLIILPIFLAWLEVLSGKVLIMTHCYNRPEFIIWQHQTFQKFLLDDYEFIVFNDASDSSISKRTKEICDSLKIQCTPVPQQIHNNSGRQPSVECGETIQYMMDTLGFDWDGTVLIIDSDMFLIREFSIEEYIQGYDLAAHPQYRQGNHDLITYLLPNLLFFNMRTFPDKRSLNFGMGVIDGIATDTAGCTYYYLKKHPNLKWRITNIFYKYEANTTIDSLIVNKLKSNVKFWKLATEHKFDFEFYNDFSFIHFRAGSNWYNMEKSKWNQKTKMLFEAMEELLGDS